MSRALFQRAAGGRHTEQVFSMFPDVEVALHDVVVRAELAVVRGSDTVPAGATLEWVHRIEVRDERSPTCAPR